MKAELDELAETHPNLSVHYTVDNARDEIGMDPSVLSTLT